VLRVSYAAAGSQAALGDAVSTRTLSAGATLQRAGLTRSSVAAQPSDFGDAVAISGSTAIVGADGRKSNTGAAYVFVRSRSGWSQEAKLTASDAAIDDQFGSSVSISGSTVIVGAPSKNLCEPPPGAGGPPVCWGIGAVYVFVRSGDVWSQRAELLGTELPGIVNGFGSSVAISGSTAVIGTAGGAAYVFVHSGSAWSEQAQLTTTSTTAAGGAVAASVAISGPTAIVGAPSKNASKGAAYVFVHSGDGWSRQAKLSASDAVSGGYFGGAVAMSGSTAVVAALGNFFPTSTPENVYIYVRSGRVWPQRVKLAVAAEGADFGSVAVAGKTAMVSTANWTVNVLVRSRSRWSPQARLTVARAGVESFGSSLAISGSTAIVGASGGTGVPGRVYVFVHSRSGWSRQAELTAARPVTDDSGAQA
jgi:FG-GAP repeat